MLSYFKRLLETYLVAPVVEPTLHPGGTPVPTPLIPMPTVPTTLIVPSIVSPPIIAPPTPPVSAPVERLKNVGPTIALVNVSSVVTNQELSACVAALQIQMDRDFAPAWKTTCNLIMIPSGGTVPPDSWVLYIMDTSDQAGALGYHDLTNEGYPVGKVFAKDDIKYGLSWTVTVSHELVEMVIDPYIQNTVFSQATNTTGTLFAIEVADPCEADQFGYLINGVLVSDFVYPTWFEDFRAPNSTKFDHMHVINAPLQLAAGGYIGVFAIPATTGWTQRLADTVPTRLKLRGAYARTNRRGLDLTH
jgi:hypothetical protein